MNITNAPSNRSLGERGFTFTEMLIATGAFGVVSVAIYSVFVSVMNLYVSGVSATRTGYSMRQVYDRMAQDIMQSPGQYAAAMDINTSASIHRLVETSNTAGSALAFAKVVAGPLEVTSFTGTSNSFSTATLRIPLETADSTNQSLAGFYDNEIKVDDYLKLVIGDANESKISSVTRSGDTWTIGCDAYTVTFNSNPTSIGTGIKPAAYVIRYAAYVVLENRSYFANRNNNLLAYYEGLVVSARRNSSAAQPPSAFQLVTPDYLTKYSRLVSTDLTQNAANSLKPFTVDQAATPYVQIRMGLKASEYDNLSSTPQFYSTANLNADVFLKSNDL